MFTRNNERTDSNNSATHTGNIEMLSANISSNNRIKTLVALIAVTVVALFSTVTPASAHVGFTPDGVNYIHYADFDGTDADGIASVIAMWTPDGVNQVETVEATIARPQILAYLNDGNHSPDGVSNLQDSGQTSPVIAMWTPDGVNQVETVNGPATAQQQVLAYLNDGNHSPDGVSNLQNSGQDGANISDLAYYYAGTADSSQVG